MKPFKLFSRLLTTVVAGLIALPATAATYTLQDDSRIIGHNYVIYSRIEDTLSDIARRFDLGYSELRRANPDVDPWMPGEGTEITIPARFILPDAPREGMVINTAEMRLFYYPPAQAGEPRKVITHPIGIGREGWKTPLGKTRITTKRENPVWIPPESIRQEHEEKGDPLPKVVPAGPENPLGAHAMNFAMPGYLMHGTDKPYGVGLRVSHGCIRLYPEDIADLFEQVAISTPVEIVYQPVKAAVQDEQLYLEAHAPFNDMSERDANNMTPMVEAILGAQDKLVSDQDWPYAENMMREAHGMVQQLNQEGIQLAEDIWFLHAGVNASARELMLEVLSEEGLGDWFWPVASGADSELLLGPFASRQEVDEMAASMMREHAIGLWPAKLADSPL